MLWQENGNKLELKPTSGQRSSCCSQLGPSRVRPLSLAQLHPGRGDPSSPEVTTQNPLSHPSQMSQSSLKQTPASTFSHPKPSLEVLGRPRHMLAPKHTTAAEAEVQNPFHRGFFGCVSEPTATQATSHLPGEAQPCPQG